MIIVRCRKLLPMLGCRIADVVGFVFSATLQSSPLQVLLISTGSGKNFKGGSGTPYAVGLRETNDGSPCETCEKKPEMVLKEHDWLWAKKGVEIMNF